MVSLNPNLASAALSIQNQQNGTAIKPEAKAEESKQESQLVASNGNSSVTLSSSQQDSSADYAQLAQNQTVRSADAAETRSNESTQTNNGLTYASSLQTQANYLMNEIAPAETKERS